jgi:hypothetical protein
MCFRFDQMRRVLVEDAGTSYTECGLVFVFVAMLVLALAIFAGGGALVFFQEIEPNG